MEKYVFSGKTEEEALEAALSELNVEKKDILFNITGASIARTCIVPNDLIPARVNQHVAIIRLKDGINHVFLNHLLFNIDMKAKLINVGESAGTTRQAITKQDLEELNIIIPPVELQNGFASFVEQIDKLKFNVQKQIDYYKELLELKMHEYFDVEEEN